MAARLGIPSGRGPRSANAEVLRLRRVSTAEDIAESFVFLASDKARNHRPGPAVDGGLVI